MSAGTWTYLGRKLWRFLACLLLLSLLHFTIPRLMPGSPVHAILGPEVVTMSHKAYADLEAELGLSDPLPVQVSRHLAEVATGNLGYSYFYHRPVLDVVFAHLQPTLLLLLPAVLCSSLLACLLGTLIGRNPGGVADLAVTSVVLVLSSLPVFLVAMVCLDIFAMRLDLLPLGGLRGTDQTLGAWRQATELIRHLVLPIVVLTVSATAGKYLVMRNSVAAQRSESYVLYARARGIGEGRILFVHLLSNASLPLLSLIGLHFAFILAGSLVVEMVFSINGMGSLFYEAVIGRDYPVLSGGFFVLTVVALLVNYTTDLLYGLIDPRVRT